MNTKSLFIVHGPAGCGKNAIAQSIAESLKDRSVVFNQSDAIVTNKQLNSYFNDYDFVVAVVEDKATLSDQLKFSANEIYDVKVQITKSRKEAAQNEL